MSLAGKLLAPPLVVVTLVAGLWFWSGVVAPGYWPAIGFGVAWFIACSVIFGRIGKSRPPLRPWLRGTFLTLSAIAVVGFWWTSVRETEVYERIVAGVAASEVPAAELGAVDPLAPQTQPRGQTRPRPARNVVERSGRVRPQSHRPRPARAGVSLPRYDSVAFWCVPFSVSLAPRPAAPGVRGDFGCRMVPG
jgi:hypothetical protein